MGLDGRPRRRTGGPREATCQLSCPPPSPWSPPWPLVRVFTGPEEEPPEEWVAPLVRVLTGWEPLELCVPPPEEL